MRKVFKLSKKHLNSNVIYVSYIHLHIYPNLFSIKHLNISIIYNIEINLRRVIETLYLPKQKYIFNLINIKEHFNEKCIFMNHKPFIRFISA